MFDWGLKAFDLILCVCVVFGVKTIQHFSTVLYLETFFWLHNNYKGKKGDLSVAGQCLIRLLGLYQCISVHWNGIVFHWLRWGPWGLEALALLTICWTHVINAWLSFIQLEVQLLELYHHGPHACMPTNIRTPTSPNCKSTTRPSGRPPPTVLHPGISTMCPTTRTMTTTGLEMWCVFKAISSFSFYEILLMVIIQMFYEWSTTTKHQWQAMSQRKGLETHCVSSPVHFGFQVY